MSFFKFFKEKVEEKFLIPVKNGSDFSIILREEKIDAKLKELIINYDSKSHEVLAFTLDENNIEKTKKIYPFYKQTMFNSSDYILLVKDKKSENKLYIFYVELKSQNLEKILQKHIFMKNIVKHIIDLLYLRNSLDRKKVIFPTVLYEGMIIFAEGTTSQEKGKRLSKYEKYKSEKFQGIFFDNSVKTLLRLPVDKDGKARNKKLFLKTFINESQLEVTNYEIDKFFKAKL